MKYVVNNNLNQEGTSKTFRTLPTVYSFLGFHICKQISKLYIQLKLEIIAIETKINDSYITMLHCLHLVNSILVMLVVIVMIFNVFSPF